MRFLSLPTLSGLLLACAVWGSSLNAAAQNRFTINGRFKIENGSLEGARVVVYKNGQKDRVRTADLSRFSMDLEIGQTYILSFEKPGFVTKKLSFDTRVPPSAAGNNFVPFEFSVSLFKQYDDLNLVVFNQPVGMIKFDAGKDDFEYDTDYSKSIQSQMKEAMDKVEKKQAEERKAEASTGKQQVEADKAKAKAEAEEQKRQTEQTRLEAERRKAEEETAKREELRKATEARKAEEERRKAEEAQRKAAPTPKAVNAVPSAPPVPKPPPPVERPATVEKPAPRPMSQPPAHAPSVAQAQGGADVRRSTERTMGEEAPPSLPRISAPAPDPITAVEPISPLETDRSEELILEPGKVITVIRLVKGERETEYRRVAHKFGAVYYFRNGTPISRDVYEQEALTGR
ncbi:MAG: hypothetical protein JNM31_10820 [Flavobacteriales bacterium]|nr:hypothetical protein [Flavobacteriales bacterium]